MLTKPVSMICTLFIACATPGRASETAHGAADDATIAHQREVLLENTLYAGYGPQSPRDIDNADGSNDRSFGVAPDYRAMSLCNIHFHENAEHRGGEFTTYAGNGDGQGNGTGFKYDGELTAEELAEVPFRIGSSAHGDLRPGDTIEVHYVHTTAQVVPGPTLAACLSPMINNPQLRVEAQVFVLVNDPAALDFTELTRLGVVNGVNQALNIPDFTGTPVEYAGSTTGPSFNEAGSPFQVTWSVRPQVAKLNILSVDTWLKNNVFNEEHAHGVRNLVDDPRLLSLIGE